MKPADQADALARLERRLKSSAASIAELDTQLGRTQQAGPPARRAPAPPPPRLTRAAGATTYVDPGPMVGQELVAAPELTEHIRALTDSVRMLLVVVGRLVVSGGGQRTTLLVWVTTATSLFAGVAALVLAIILWITVGDS